MPAGVRAASAGRGRTAAGASATTKAWPTDLPRDPGKHVAKLRGQGADDASIRKALTDMGYPAAVAKNAAPGAGVTPRPAPAPPADPPPADPNPFNTVRSARFTSDLPRPDVGAGGISGFVLGLVGTAVLINFMHGGVAQVKRWGAAKFLNIPGPAPATPGSSGGSGSGSGSGAGGGGGSSW